MKVKAPNWLKYNFVDSTALLSISTPISATLETFVVGMSDDVSLNARLINAGLAYAGFGGLIARGRDGLRKLFRITDETKGKIQHAIDAAYAATLQLVALPIFYYIAGARDTKEIVIGTLVGIGLGAVIGGPAGYTIDTFRDLTGLKKSQRVPELVRERNSKVKKGLASLLAAGAIGLTAGIYALTPNRENTNYQQTLEQQVDHQENYARGPN
ncbi:MAG: hypothetical protein IIA87_01610 [Nanoarchaeota archaeon]|nr:hypothetical protein [Nanoarchaeota archaeon]